MREKLTAGSWHALKGKMGCEDRGRDWSDADTSTEMPAATGNLSITWLHPSETDVEHLSSRTGGHHAVVLSHQVHGYLHGSPRTVTGKQHKENSGYDWDSRFMFLPTPYGKNTDFWMDILEMTHGTEQS